MTRDLDILTAPGLKHLRDRWWDATFDEFVSDTLQPRPDEWVLEVGVGTGVIAAPLGLMAPGDVRYVGIDRRRDRLHEARRAAANRGLSLAFAAAQAAALPFADGVFAATLCVGVLQYATDPARLVRELSRVTCTDGRVLIVEPDNAARYVFSSLDSGMRTFALSQEFFRTHHEAVDPSIGPHVAELFRASGVNPIAVQVFPVSTTRLGAPVSSVWQARREEIARLAAESVPRAIADEWLRALEQYAADSTQAGPTFLEIQHTMLVATVGQKQGVNR